jgi:hypothetical protein
MTLGCALSQRTDHPQLRDNLPVLVGEDWEGDLGTSLRGADVLAPFHVLGDWVAADGAELHPTLCELLYVSAAHVVQQASARRRPTAGCMRPTRPPGDDA